MSIDHYENFPVASWVMPRRFRPAVLAIYRFARTADDIADEGDAAAEARLRELAALRGGLERIASGEAPADRVLGPLAAAIARHRLPLAPLHALLDAFSQDVVRHRYATFEELMAYCARSANPIGRLLLHLFDVGDAQSLRQSDAICSALQLVNFWQDVALDWRKGRIYLPQEDLGRYAVTEDQVARGVANSGWRERMSFEVDRTRAMLKAGEPLCRRLPGRLGLELRLIVAGGNRILDKLAAADGDVFRRRPTLAPADWLRVGGRALLALPL